MAKYTCFNDLQMKQPCNFGRAIGQIKMKRKTIWTITFMVTKTGHNFKPKKKVA